MIMFPHWPLCVVFSPWDTNVLFLDRRFESFFWNVYLSCSLACLFCSLLGNTTGPLLSMWVISLTRLFASLFVVFVAWFCQIRVFRFFFALNVLSVSVMLYFSLPLVPKLRQLAFHLSFVSEPLPENWRRSQLNSGFQSIVSSFVGSWGLIWSFLFLLWATSLWKHVIPLLLRFLSSLFVFWLVLCRGFMLVRFCLSLS